MLSCEHASHAVPAHLRERFGDDRMQALLASHRGYDLGALALARRLARALEAPLFAGTVTRLVVDLNRSPTNPRVFGAPVRDLDARERAALLRRYHAPHWARVGAHVARVIEAGDLALHVAVHSFTPRPDGHVRRTQIGLLYDPARPLERALCARWKRRLEAVAPHLRVRRNDPYEGRADGLPTALRRVHPADRYVGVELEVNQALLMGPTDARAAVSDALRATLAAVMTPTP